MTNRFNKKIKRGPRQRAADPSLRFLAEEQAMREMVGKEGLAAIEEEAKREVTEMIEKEGLVSAYFRILEEDEEEFIAEEFARLDKSRLPE